MKTDQRAAPRLYLYLVPLVICAMGLLAYGNSFHNQFVFDDYTQIVSNPLITNFQNIGDAFRHSLTYSPVTKKEGSFYRPLQTLSLMADYHFWKLDPLGYHITNTLLHISVCILIFYLLLITTRRSGPAFFAALVYLVHPAHTEAVAYISGRADSLSAIFLLVMMIAQYRYWSGRGSRAVIYGMEFQKAKFQPLKIAAKVIAKRFSCYFVVLAALAGALLSKEHAVWFPILLIFFEYSARGKSGYSAVKGKRLFFYAPLVLLTALWFILKNKIALTEAMIKHPMPLAQRLVMGFSSIAEYLRVSFFPVGLHMEHRVPPVSWKYGGYYLPRVIAAAVFIGVVYYVWGRGKKDPHFRVIFFGLGLFLLALFPYLDIIFQLNAPFAEHWLYIPEMGISASVVYSVFHYFGKGRLLRMAGLLGAVIAIFTMLTIRQNTTWKDEITFCEHTIKYAPHSANAYNNLAIEYINQGRLSDAKQLLLKAIRVDPDYEFARNNLRKLESLLSGRPGSAHEEAR